MRSTSNIVILLMVAVIAVGGLSIVVPLDQFITPLVVKWATIAAIGILLIVLGFTLLPRLMDAIRLAFAQRTTTNQHQFSFETHSPEKIKAAIETFNRSGSPNIPQLIDYLIFQAVSLNSSDIHLVPYRDFITIRFRIDGIMMDLANLSEQFKQPVINRLKVLSELVTYVHDKPQDGRFDVAIGNQRLDLRVSFMPTMHGERVVMRILNRADLGLGLENLGLVEAQVQSLLSILSRSQGMMILTGPTGSGKTKTIYCSLQEILKQSHNTVSIYTLEDPIEYDLPHINQTQIEEGQDFTFSKGLRTMLRQDPDVIMVGEVRDLDTARIAIQAGMTGHFIITTVHAKSAAAVPARLIEMGVDPHSVASAITAIVAQRLVRVLCPECRRAEKPTPGQEAKLGRKLPNATFWGPVGCPKCSMKGYIGRKGIFEILEVDETVRKLIIERSTPGEIHKGFLTTGVKTLVDNGLDCALRGETSLDELLRVLPVHKEFA
jgi:general secretion pathway protein E